MDGKYAEAIMWNNKMKLLTTEFFEEVFKEKNFLSKKGQRKED